MALHNLQICQELIQGRSQPLTSRWARSEHLLNFSSFSCMLSHFSSNFLHFSSSFWSSGWAARPPGNALAMPLSLSFHTNFGCGMFSFAMHVSSLSSIMLITLVGFDRYFAVYDPIKYRITKSKKQLSCILTILTWTISAIFSCFFSDL